MELPTSISEPQLATLKALDKAEHRTLSGIAEACDLEQKYISNHLNRCREKGWATATKPGTANIWEITELGRAVLDNLDSIFVSSHNSGRKRAKKPSSKGLEVKPMQQPLNLSGNANRLADSFAYLLQINSDIRNCIALMIEKSDAVLSTIEIDQAQYKGFDALYEENKTLFDVIDTVASELKTIIQDEEE